MNLATLKTAAESWIGTPFCERSAVKGAGVCCHALPLEIYFEAGWLPRFEYPAGAPGTARVELADQFIAGDGGQWFTRALIHQAGDTLQFQLGRTSHFMLSLEGDRYVHATKTGVQIAHGLQKHWLPRLKRVWRPRVISQLPTPNSYLPTPDS
jgi:cell wall-associated NlpC family hydrolase